MNIIHNLRKLLASFITRLILISLLCSGIPILIVGSVGYITARRIAEEKILETISVLHSQLRQNLNFTFSRMENICDYTENYIYVLMNKPIEPVSEYVDYLTSARQAINTLNDIFNFYAVCAFLPANI